MNIAQIIDQQKVSTETKNIFLNLWNVLAADKKQELEKLFTTKPDLIKKFIAILEEKKQAVANLDNSFDEILKKEETLLKEI